MFNFFKYSSILLVTATLSGCGDNTKNTADIASFTTDPNLHSEADLRLWYERPALNWNHALPIGNGRLGAMIFGEPNRERLQLNEDTIWAGGPNNNISPTANAALAEIRKLIDQGEYEKAQILANQQFVSPNNGMPYQTIGSLIIEQSNGTISNYYRDLNLADATASVRYESDEKHYERRYFASLTDNAIFVKYSAPKGQLHLTIAFESPMRHNIRIEDQQLVLRGQGSGHEGKTGKIRYTTRVSAELEDGKLSFDDTHLIVRDATSVTLRIVTATNFVNYANVSADPDAISFAQLTQAATIDFDQAHVRNTQAYQALFNRVELDLGTTAAANIDTENRIKNFANTFDPALATLYFQYGRYLLIASSQPNTQPANLQGIWNEHTNPPWDSKYTVNINTEMNYWPAEPTNLSELHQPLFDMLQDLSITGQQSAKDIYDAKGWMMHHNTDLWRITGQVDRPFYGQWQTASAWLTQHLWYRYLHTGDKAFLEKYYPVIRGAAEFFADSLQLESHTGYRVVTPSNSPENNLLRNPSTPDAIASLSAGTTMDNQLVFDLFDLVINASHILKIDTDFAEKIKQLQAQLPPMQIGRFGQLQEWLYDLDDPQDHHRHISHLYGLFPSNQISPLRTPALAQAAITSIEHRGDKSTGWSMGWKINWWARLFNGDRAYKLLQEQINLTEETIAVTEKGGTYANLLDAHPPFQIDGNFGVTTGIAEMLVQSHDGAVHLLPALPKVWPNGKVKGLVTRGGFVIDMTWSQGKVNRLSVYSKLGGQLRLRSFEPLVSDKITMKKAEGENSNPLFNVPVIAPILDHSNVAPPAAPTVWEYDVSTDAGKTYHLL